MSELTVIRPRAVSERVVPVQDIGDPSETDRLDFSSLVAAVRRRLWLFLAIAGGVFLASIVITVLMTPEYTATTRVALNSQQIQVAPSSISGTANNPVVSSVPPISSAIDTEVTVIESRQVAGRVVQALRLDRDPEFSEASASAHVGMLGHIKRAIHDIVARLIPGGQQQAPESAEDYTIDAVLANLTVLRYNLTNSIDISYTDEDPAKAALIANAFAEQYVEYQVESKFNTSEQANVFLQKRIDEMLGQYTADTERLQQYKIAHNLMSAGSTTLTEQEIAGSNQQVAEAKAQLAADEADLKTARDQLAHGSSGGDVGEALSSGVISALRAQRATISSHVADLQGHYGEKYPELVMAQRQLADIDQQIQAEINRVISNLEAKVEVSQQRLASLEGTLAATRGSLAQNNEAEVGLDQLQQAATSSQALYQSYLDRLKETSAQQGGELPDARILSRSPLPTSPSRPIVMLNLALGLTLGIGLGVMAILFSEWLEPGLATAHDVETRVGRRYLGGVPLLASVAPKRSRLTPLTAVVSDPHSAYAEAFRNLRASIEYAAGGAHSLAIIVSSALPREGKTTVAIGLARTAALQGVPTVLVDCDLRRRGVNEVVESKEDRPGLIEVLSGTASIDKALVTEEETGLTILPINRTREPTTDLFGGEAMDTLLDDLKARFQLVILDSAPLLPVADARVIAAKTDVLILVARWRKTDVGAVRAAMRLIPSDKVMFAGVALTRIDMRKQAKFGYGDPGYYYEQYRGYYA
jgi:polysaccharide biosynthesis transport protein